MSHHDYDHRHMRRSDSSLVENGPGPGHPGHRSNSIVDKLKRVLRVDSDDDTDTLHNKYKETAKDREEKLRMFEEQLNIKVYLINHLFLFKHICISSTTI